MPSSRPRWRRGSRAPTRRRCAVHCAGSKSCWTSSSCARRDRPGPRRPSLARARRSVTTRTAACRLRVGEARARTRGRRSQVGERFRSTKSSLGMPVRRRQVHRLRRRTIDAGCRPHRRQSRPRPRPDHRRIRRGRALATQYGGMLVAEVLDDHLPKLAAGDLHLVSYTVGKRNLRWARRAPPAATRMVARARSREPETVTAPAG